MICQLCHQELPPGKLTSPLPLGVLGPQFGQHQFGQQFGSSNNPLLQILGALAPPTPVTPIRIEILYNFHLSAKLAGVK